MTASPLARRLLAAALALACAGAAAKDGATGTVTIDGKSWPVADAIALMDGEDLQIVFAQAQWDRAEWADDGEFGTFDLFEFAGDAEAQQLNVDIDEEKGTYSGHNIRYSGSSSSGGYSSDYESSVTLTSRTADRVAGTVKMKGTDLATDVAFDLPITKTGPLARAGTPLPADGGEPGKVLRAVVDATLAGDVDKMTELSHPDRRAGIEAAKKAGEIDQMLTMAKLFTPKIKKVTGGTVDGDKAWVEFVGDEGGSEVKGTGTLTRMNGKWYLEGIQTRSGS
jgi:hypothetical protein